MKHSIAFLIAMFLVTQHSLDVLAEGSLRLYIGTGGDAIYASMFDPETGALSAPERMADTPRPSFLWVTPSTNSLYSITEMRRGQEAKDASIVAWSVDPASGKLTQLSRQDAMGDGPCFVTVNPQRTFAAVANYGSGSVSVYPISKNGSVGPASGHVQHQGASVDPQRQTAPHAHSILFDPSGKRLAAADLGTDKIYLYDLQDDGSLAPSSPPAIDLDPGAGPRHFVFSPDNQYLLALGEMSGTITTYRYQPPSIEKLAVVNTMANNAPANAPRASAEILFHPNGKFVYCSNRGPNEIAAFAYDASTGTLRRLFGITSGGVHPRNFRFSPDGRFMLVANQQSDNIVVYRVNEKSGELKPTGIELDVPAPMCLKFWDASEHE